MLKTVNSTLTNQFFPMSPSTATGLLIRRIKTKGFPLGVSSGVSIGIIIGCPTIKWVHTISEDGVGYANAKRIPSTGVVAQMFLTFFLLLFLVSTGLKMRSSIGTMFKRYGMKLVVIGTSTPVVSTLVACALYGSVLSSNQSITSSETIGVYAGSMTTIPGYGIALNAAGHVDYRTLYKEVSGKGKDRMLLKIDPLDALSGTDTTALNKEQIATYREAASSAVSLGHTVASPMGVLVIAVMPSVLPRLFRIDMEQEKENYQKEANEVSEGGKTAKELPLSFMMMSLVAVIGITAGSTTIPLGSSGSFSMGAAGGVLLTTLILNYIGQIGPANFRMDSKTLGIMHRMGLTFFIAVVGLCCGYNVATSLMGSGLVLAMAAVFAEMTAVLVSFFIGHELFGLDQVILSGAIAGGCAPVPDLGAVISSIGSEGPTAGCGAAQLFAILANVLLATIFSNIML